MASKFCEPWALNVAKSGGKLGVWVPQSTIGILPRSPVRITVRNQFGKASFIALAPGWATIPSRIRRDLSIRHGERLSVLEVKGLRPHFRKDFHINDGNVDMLSLIPEQTDKGYRVFIDEHEETGIPWLRVWYYHPRGAARQIELKRYVDASRIGQLLGQLQAEGNKKGPSVVFKNSSISEHADFVAGLRDLGISPANILARCIFNPTKLTIPNVQKYSDEYENATGIRVSSVDESMAMKGAVVVDTCVRSTVLRTILISAMDELRTGHYDDQQLRSAFLAKLLNGDGTIDARKTSKRLDVRLKIVDQNTEYLRDYANILAREGFRAKLIPEEITVRAYCTWLNLTTLYKIRAFRGTKNWTKLLCSMKIALVGRQTRGYKRIQELSDLKTFTSKDVCSKYMIGNRATNLWLARMTRLGLVERLAKVNRHNHIRYRATPYGKAVCTTISEMERDYTELSGKKNSEDAETILESAKVKSTRSSRSTEERTQTC